MAGKPRQDPRQNTRRSILDAARDMFVRKGYEATTMRAIAARVDISPTAIYHHFRNKDALLTELASVDFRALAEAFLRIGRVPDPLERLRRIGEAYVEFANENPMQYQLLFMTPRPKGVGQPTGIARGDPSEDAYAFLRQTCAEAIATGQLLPEVTDPDAMAQMLWGVNHGIVSLQIVKQHDDWIAWRDVRTTARAARAAMVRGLRRQPPAG